jgi:DNA-binding MarR family transcriptional regulator
MNNTRTSYHAKWRKAQKALLPADWRETKAYVDEETYERAVALAESRNERLPVTIGRLAAFAIEVLEGKASEETKMEVASPPATPILQIPAEALLQAILASRFPGDTGALRLRQFAFVQIVADQNARGRAPTATEMAVLTGAFRSQMDLLSKQLVERGLITRKHAPGHKGAKSAKLLMIADNALEQFNQAHIAETGEPIEGIEELRKMGR